MELTPKTPLRPDPSRIAKVLVIDDEPATAAAIAELLREMGHAPTVCHDWIDALRHFGNGEVDLVLMDAVMPTVDGFKLTKIFRSRATSYVPIVFLTGLADQHAREQGIAIGADDFLTKPVDKLELRMRLTAMLRIRALTQDLESKSKALARLASVDGLTGIANRRAFDERLPAELESSVKSGTVFSLLLVDIDHFKRVNDTFGHAVGDQLLTSFGKLLSELTRACDLPFRYGGEEFAVLATNTSAQQAVFLAQRLRSAFSLRTQEATACGSQTISIGVCGCDQVRSPSVSRLIEAADAALYRAKAGGRNQVCVYDPMVDGPDEMAPDVVVIGPRAVKSA